MSRLLIPLILGLVLSSCNRNIGAVFTRKEKLEIIEPDFEYMSSKAKFKFDNAGKKVSALANFRIKKDSIIWISVSGFGLEAARIFIDVENVRVLDRLNKQYYEYTFAELSEKYKFDFNFKMIQSVLLGNLIDPYNNQKFEKTDLHYAYDDIQGDYTFKNYIGNATMKLERVLVTDGDSENSISVNYSDFVQVKNQIFPNEISAIIDYASSQKTNTQISISYNKMEIEASPLKFPFSVSNKYERK